MHQKKTIKIKFADMWGGFDINSNFISNILKQHYNVVFSDDPDFLFFSCFGATYLDYNNCVKIFITGENILPDFNKADYATGFDYMDFGDRYLHYHPFLAPASIIDRSSVTDDMANRQFCNFIYSNSNSGEGAELRQVFCKRLMEYKHVDCPGKVLNNMSAEDLEPRYGDWVASKKRFLKKYKFTIAFENSSSNGYTTEKLIDPLLAFSVPIYYGNPEVVRDFNPKAFINCNDYNNDIDAVIERVKELDNDPVKYLAMLRENPMQPDFKFDDEAQLEAWLIKIIEKGNHPFNKDPRNWSDRMRKDNNARQLCAKLDEQQEHMTQMQNQLKQYAAIDDKRRRDVRHGYIWRRKESGNHVRIYVLGLRILKRKKH